MFEGVEQIGKAAKCLKKLYIIPQESVREHSNGENYGLQLLLTRH